MDFSCAYLNIRGLTSKLDEIEMILEKHKFDIFCLSEIFLEENDSNHINAMPGYRVLRRDRLSDCGGWSFMLYT